MRCPRAGYDSPVPDLVGMIVMSRSNRTVTDRRSFAPESSKLGTARTNLQWLELSQLDLPEASAG
eukprot:357319-Hanusia_phi.AAC.11